MWKRFIAPLGTSRPSRKVIDLSRRRPIQGTGGKSRRHSRTHIVMYGCLASSLLKGPTWHRLGCSIRIWILWVFIQMKCTGNLAVEPSEGVWVQRLSLQMGLEYPQTSNLEVTNHPRLTSKYIKSPVYLFHCHAGSDLTFTEVMSHSSLTGSTRNISASAIRHFVSNQERWIHAVQNFYNTHLNLGSLHDHSDCFWFTGASSDHYFCCVCVSVSLFVTLSRA